ncbi:BTB/POZ domain-containing protein KCTD9 [Halotydeus destructor]|nr:BTB/POZ domain-containing protein KCTD9 [Halotydeus destructor]
MARVNVFRNGSRTCGKVIAVPDQLDELLRNATEKLTLTETASRIFTGKGSEIDDVKLIKDDEVLYISQGEDFEAIKLPEGKAQLSDWITLNVGGRRFTTTLSTLTTKEPDSMLARMFARDSSVAPSPRDTSGAYLIDRSPEYFEPIIGWLRHGDLILDDGVNARGVLEEAKFYGIETLISTLEHMVECETQSQDYDGKPLTRRDVVNVLITSPCTSELRFQGVNLCGADLSKLDLRYINLKYAQLRGANLSGANLSYACLERADLSGSCLDGAILFGVKMVCCNLKDSSLRNINCEDPTNLRTNMEGVNLKAANLEGSQLAHVNLRVATLKNAILCNCDLRSAILAGADLEDCDLSGSDLHEANLRGANLKGATFELMMTPLHMAQAMGAIE